MKKILFVCHGNICRSPMAEFVMKDLVSKANLDDQFEIASAATSSEELGNKVYPPVRKLLGELGISCENKRARKLVKDDYDKYDLIIDMDKANRRNMMYLFGDDKDGKIRLLLEYVNSNREVTDPWYTGDFQTTYNDVLSSCKALLAACVSPTG